MIGEIINTTLNGIKDELDNSITKNRLIKLLYLECRYNLGILDTTRWKGVDDQFKIEICKNLKSDIAQVVFTHEDSGILTSIFRRAYKFKTEPHSEFNARDSKIASLINRIEILKAISSLPPEIQSQSKAKYSIRIRNLRQLILDLLIEIDT